MTDFCVCKQIGSNVLKKTIAVVFEIIRHLVTISSLIVAISTLSFVARHFLGEGYIFFKDDNQLINEIINSQFPGVHFSGIPLIVMTDTADFSLLILFLFFGVIDCLNAHEAEK